MNNDEFGLQRFKVGFPRFFELEAELESFRRSSTSRPKFNTKTAVFRVIRTSELLLKASRIL